MFSSKDRNPFLFFENCTNVRSPIEYKPYILIKHNYLTAEAAIEGKQKETDARLLKIQIDRLNTELNVKLDIIMTTNNILITPTSRTTTRIQTMTLDESISQKIAAIKKNGNNDDLPEKDIETIHQLHLKRNAALKLGKDEEKIKYIFCGKPQDDELQVMEILQEVEKHRKINESDSHILKKYFGNHFKTFWGDLDAAHYSEIKFISFYILPDSNVHFVQNLIELLLNIPITYQYVWGYNDLKSSNSLKFYLEDFYRYYYDAAEENVSKINIQLFFEKLGMSQGDILKMFENMETNSFSREDLMNEQPLCDALLSYFEYESLNFQNIYQKRIKIGHFPDSNPFFAFVNKDTYNTYGLLLKNDSSKIAIADFFQNKTLNSFNLQNNEIHFVSLYDFSVFLKRDKDSDSELRKMVDPVFKRYFRNVNELSDYLEPKFSPEKNASELLNEIDDAKKRNDAATVARLEKSETYEKYKIYESNNDVFHFMHTPMQFPQIPSASLTIVNLLETIFKVDFAFNLLYKTNLNLRDIVNQFRLSDKVPFVRLFDEQRNENIYRIFRDSFVMDNLDKISRSTLESWLFMSNWSVQLKQLTKISEIKRCLTFKLRLCNQIESHNDPIPIDEYHPVFDDNTQQNKFTVRYKNGQIEGNIESYLFTSDKSAVYHHKPVYMDIYIFSDGTMRIKFVFDPNCIFHVDYLNAIEETVNYFITILKEFPETSNCLDGIKLCDILNRSNDNYLNSTLTNSCLLEYAYTDEYYITYENLKQIIKMFMPYFHIVEPVLDTESSVQFYFEGSYRDATIIEVLKNDRYNIRVRGDRYENIPRYLLDLKGQTKSIGFLNFRYKRVSNYKIDESLKEDDRHLDENGIDIKFYFETQTDAQRRYKIELNHFKNIDEYNTIIELIYRIMNLYYLYFVSKPKDHSLFEQFGLVKSDKIILAIAGDVNLDVALNTSGDDVFSSMGLGDMDLSSLIDQQPDEFASDDVESASEHAPITPMAVPGQESSSGIETQQTTISSQNLLLSTLYESDPNQFKTYAADKWSYTTACQPNNIRYPKPIKKNEFSKILNTGKARPVVNSIELPPVADDSSMNALPYSAGLGLTYLGNKPGIGREPEEKYCTPGDEIGSKKRCVSILYGSQSDIATWQNVFMCPKIWCMLDRIPLHPRHLDDGQCRSCGGCDRFISQADITVEAYMVDKKTSELNDSIKWRLCKNCDHDILDHNIKCPVCKSGPLDPNNQNFRPTLAPNPTSLFISKAGHQTYIYPGFLNASKHPKNIHSMCCFNNPNTHLEEITGYKIDVSKVYNEGKYIQSYGKSLDRGRCGQLPKNFAGLFDLSPNYFNVKILADKSDKENMLYRFGVNVGVNNVLDCLRAIVLKDDVYKKNPEVLDNALAENVDLDILYGTPLLLNAMTDTTSNNLSPVQIFIEYVYSDAYKYDMTLFQFLNRDWTWMGLGSSTDIPEEISQKGVNIFIFTLNNEGKLVLELPLGYIQPYQKGVEAYSILLFKKPEGLEKSVIDSFCGENNARSHYAVYEPIFALRKSESPHWDKFQKAFHWDHPIITHIMEIIESMKDELVKTPDLIYKGNDFPKRTLDWLLQQPDIPKVQTIITDSANLVVGAILRDNVYIPLFPTSYDGAVPKMEQTVYWQDFNSLQNYEDCLNGLYKYQSYPDFEWMRPIKIIRGKDGYNGFMTLGGTIIPFQELSTVVDNMLPFLTLDYQDIEKSIQKFQQRMPVSKKMRYADLLDLNVSKDKMFILRDDVKQRIIKTILFPTENDKVLLKIPIEPEEFNPDYHPHPYQKSQFKPYSYLEATKMYHDLYYRMMGKVRCCPVGVRMNPRNKLISSIFLETGDEIEVVPNKLIYARDSKKNTLILHFISDLEKSKSISKITGYDWNRYFMDAEQGDQRVHYIQAINYKIKSYMRFRFEIAQILAKFAIDRKKNIEKILNLPRSNVEKRNAIYEIINDLVIKYMNTAQINQDVVIRTNNVDILDNCLSHNNNSTACSMDPFCSWNPLDESNRSEWIKQEKMKAVIQQKEIDEYIVSNGESLEEDAATNENLYWNLRFEKQGNCKLLVDPSSNKKFVYQLVEELVRNNIKRNEILENKIKLVETNLSYHIYSGERFFTTSDVKSRLYDDIYCKLLRYRLKTLDYFTRNSSMYSEHLPELFLTELEEPIKEFPLLERQMLNVHFEMDGEDAFRIPENDRQQLVRILDQDETQLALHRIMVLNTPLDTYRIGSTTNDIDFIIEAVAGRETVYTAAIGRKQPPPTVPKKQSAECTAHKTQEECTKYGCTWGKTGKCSKKRAALSKPPPQSPKGSKSPPPQSPKGPKALSFKPSLAATSALKPSLAATSALKPASKATRFAEEVPLVEKYNGFRLNEVVKVPGDGTCLFHSAAIGLRTVGAFEGTGHDLREQTAQYLKDTLDNGKNLNVSYSQATLNKLTADNTLTFRQYLSANHIYNGSNPEDFMKEHIKQIAQHKWGTEIEVWAFQNMFPRVNIEVYSAPRGDNYLRKITPGQENGGAFPTIRIYNAAGDNPNGTHYDALPASRPRGEHEDEPDVAECPELELGQPVRIKGHDEARYFIDRRWSNERAGQCVAIRVVSSFINDDDIDPTELERVSTNKLKKSLLVGFNNNDVVAYRGKQYIIHFTKTSKEDPDDLDEQPTQHFILYELDALQEVPLDALEL